MLKKLLGFLLLSSFIFIPAESSPVKGSLQITGGAIAGTTAFACIQLIRESLKLMKTIPAQASETDKFYFTTACAVILPLGVAAFYAGIVSLIAFNAGFKNLAYQKKLGSEK